MKTLLRIDASAQRQESCSRALADYFETCWRTTCPNGKIVTRDLAIDPPPHLDAATVAVFYAGGEPGGWPIPPGIAWSDRLIAELAAADDVVVSSAVYNFGPPSSLKAWIDHIVRFGRTITRHESGVDGLLTGKSACLLTARGANASASPDYQGPLLQAIFRYIGFSRIGWISIEGTKFPDGRLEERIAKARADVEAWIGRAAFVA